MMNVPSGNNAIPVSVIPNGIASGNVAIPVYGIDVIPQGEVAIGAFAVPVVIIDDSDLVGNGGQFIVEGSVYPMKIFSAPSNSPVTGGNPIPIYITNDWTP